MDSLRMFCACLVLYVFIVGCSSSKDIIQPDFVPRIQTVNGDILINKSSKRMMLGDDPVIAFRYMVPQRFLLSRSSLIDQLRSQADDGEIEVCKDPAGVVVLGRFNQRRVRIDYSPLYDDSGLAFYGRPTAPYELHIYIDDIP